jgi:hypothetical protein
MKKISKVKQYQLEYWAINMWCEKMKGIATETEMLYMSRRLVELKEKLVEKDGFIFGDK